MKKQTNLEKGCSEFMYKKHVDTRVNRSHVSAGPLVLTSASKLLGLEALDSLVSTCTHVDNETPRSSLLAKREENKPRPGRGIWPAMSSDPHLALFRPLSTRQKPCMRLQSHKICGKPKTN